MREKFGDEQVLQWRRSYDTKPPKGESLKDTFKRTVPFYKKNVEADLKEGKSVLDRKSTRLNSSHSDRSRMPSSA